MYGLGLMPVKELKGNLGLQSNGSVVAKLDSNWCFVIGRHEKYCLGCKKRSNKSGLDEKRLICGVDKIRDVELVWNRVCICKYLLYIATIPT